MKIELCEKWEKEERESTWRREKEFEEEIMKKTTGGIILKTGRGVKRGKNENK